MLHYETLTWPQLDALDRAKTVAFIAFSPLEEHGPHLPIGTDLYMASYFAETIAARMEAQRPDLTALVLPPVPLGAGTIPMRGSINITVDVVYDIARQMGSALARDGFRHIVFTNGHLAPWHLLALENAAMWVSRRYRVGAVAPAASLARDLIRRDAIAGELGQRMAAEEVAELLKASHGGMLETSVMLHLHPELVQPSYRSLPRLTHSALRGWRGRTPAHWPGYVGSPASGEAEWGAMAVERLIDLGTQLVIRMTDEGRAAAQAGRLLPRVPFWLARRRVTALAGAAIAGVGATVLATRLLTIGGKQRGRRNA
ncbi:MAG: creatininase family protein [Ktedonobacterales bacterium]|nr:creatininase family protein [Ktedonobacterales bacterium]